MSDADYVIVGAGSAGCVLANRLTASGRQSVTLLEAGGSDLNVWVQMPIGYGKAFYNRGLNWCYQSEPDPGTGGRVSYWPRGKVIGGSSSINAMVFIRGQAADYDGWAALGNGGWAYADLLPYFKRLEDNRAGADDWRGSGGPITVTDIAKAVHPLCDDYLAAGVEAGLPRNPDFNGASQEGVGIYQITTRGRRRCSAARGYLHPAAGRPNLRIVKRAQATRILFEGRRAVAVEYRQGEALHQVRAKREVLLAAGAVNSPQLLQLSGVGDGALLKAKGIEVLLDAPQVGGNLQDHIGLDHIFEANRPTLNNVLRPWWGRAAVGLRYLLTGGGPLSLSVNQGGGFFRSSPERERPNMQLYFSPVSYIKAPPGKRPMMSPDPYPGFLLGVSNCHPSSRGRIEIRSADPFEAPAIHPNYLSTNEDVVELLEASRFLRRLSATASLRAISKRELLPGPEVDSDADMVEDLRQRAGTVFHPCGTCAMGPDAKTSVVDPALRVHGLEGLRVIDASIMPRITAGNLNAPTMMIAEKAADLLLAEAG
ncbi:MAG: GMC family oxidoreductase N-terminal domain-containing protein [Rhodospirillales bacterium]